MSSICRFCFCTEAQYWSWQAYAECRDNQTYHAYVCTNGTDHIEHERKVNQMNHSEH